MKKNLILLFVFVFAAWFNYSGLAQTYDENIAFGDAAAKEADYYTAAYYYSNAWKLDSSKYSVAYKIAESNRVFNNYKTAAKWYSIVDAGNDSDKFPESMFWLAVMQKSCGDYENAASNFDSYYKKNAGNDNYFTKKALHETEVCKHIDVIKNDTMPVRVDHLDATINTPYTEFAPIKLGDSLLFFSSLRPLATYTAESQPLIPNAYLTKVYKTFSTIAGWTLPKEIIPTVNDPEKNTANIAFSPDHKRFYFTRCNTNNLSKPHCAIYVSNYKDNTWQKAEKLNDKINLPDYTSTQPTISVDENKDEVLYFASDRPGGSGMMDIWYSVYKNNTYNEPVNLGNIINSPGDEITPFYHSPTSTLYFSSDWHDGLGGYDVFQSKGGFNQWTPPKNLGTPLNTSFNEVYYTINEVDSDGYFTSNRPGSLTIKGETCCNDIYSYEWTGTKKIVKKKEIVIIPDTIRIEDWVKALLPLTLYFHNDIPDPGSIDTLTKLSYKTTLNDYVQMRGIYKNEYSKGLAGAAKDKAESDIDEFFDNYVAKGFAKLERFSDWLMQDLKRGSIVKITVKGYCSPLHTTEYNAKLAKRRISSLVNYFKRYNNGIFMPYLEGTSADGGKLEIHEDAIGKLQANPFVSDNPNDQRNSIYSRAAALERKIQIIFYNSDKAGTQSANSNPVLTVDNQFYNFGTLKKTDKKIYYLSYQNTGKSNLIITSVESDCGCVTAQWSSNPLTPGSKNEIELSFDPKNESGELAPSIVITSNAEVTKTTFRLKAIVE